MKKTIFREVSIERLQSPEQLDQLLQIITPRGWLALTAIWLLLLTVIVWSIFGKLTTTVSGNGILIKTGGVFDIVSLGTGQITDISVNVGDILQKGQPIARIGQPELVEQIKQLKLKLAEYTKRKTQIQKESAESLVLNQIYRRQQRQLLAQTIQLTEEQLRFLQEKLDFAEKPTQNESNFKLTYISIKQDYTLTKEKLAKAKTELKLLDLDDLKLKKQLSSDAFSIDNTVQDILNQITFLESQMEKDSKILSPYSGRVLEIKMEEGDLVSVGKPIVSIELVGKEIKDLEAIIYVPPSDGKRIKAGMEVAISPSTVKKEEHGYMLGRVTKVSEFPTTFQGMMRTLNNEDLVKQLAGKFAPIQVSIDLVPSDKTPSGYQWSSGKGPDDSILSGTLCSSEIVIKKERPIQLVIPFMRRKVGI